MGEIVKKQSSLMELGQAKVGEVIANLKKSSIELTQEQKKCGNALLSAIVPVLQNKGLTLEAIEPNSLYQAMEKAILLELNATASPHECYVQLRNYMKPDKSWGQKIEFGIEGAGHEKLLKNFGIDILELGQVWQVREGDEWTPPSYNGFEPLPPKWIPKGKGKVVRVVYPLKKNSGRIEYHIAEREDVLPNLLAHIRQNMMKEDDKAKNMVLSKVEQMGLDKTLTCDDESILKWVSPAWKESHSRDAMILRKMVNNAIRKYPKDFKSSQVEIAYQTASDEQLREAQNDKEVLANSGAIIDVDDYDAKPTNPSIDKDTGEVLQPINEPIEPIEDEEELNEMEIVMQLNDAYSVIVQNGTYAGKTLAEIKKEKPGWFNFVYEKSTNKDTEIMKAIGFILKHDSELKK